MNRLSISTRLVLYLVRLAPMVCGLGLVLFGVASDGKAQTPGRTNLVTGQNLKFDQKTTAYFSYSEAGKQLTILDADDWWICVPYENGHGETQGRSCKKGSALKTWILEGEK